MATLALGAVGAGIGSLFANPVAGFMAGVTLGSLLFPSQGPQQRGMLDDLRVTGSAYGTAIPIVYGASRIGGNLIWSTDLQQHEQDLSGKGPPVAANYTYSVNCAVAVCRGPIVGIQRIWAEDLVIYDASASPPTKYNVTIYTGTEVQLPDATIAGFEGEANVPAFRGLAYVVFETLTLTDWGNRIPSFTFELATDPLQPTRVFDVLTDLANQVGLVEDTDFAFGAAYDDIGGYVADHRGDVSTTVEPLLRTFLTDMCEIDGQLVAVRRGEPEIGTIEEGDMAARDWQAGSREDSAAAHRDDPEERSDASDTPGPALCQLRPALSAHVAERRAIRAAADSGDANRYHGTDRLRRGGEGVGGAAALRALA